MKKIIAILLILFINENVNSQTSSWSTIGNTSTTYANVIGNKNNYSLRFITNNIQRFVIDSTGKVYSNGVGGYKTDLSSSFKKFSWIDSNWASTHYGPLKDTSLWKRTDSSTILVNPWGNRVMEIFNTGNIDAGASWSVGGSISMGSNNGFDSLLYHNTVFGYQCLGGGGQQSGYPKTLTTAYRNTLIGALCGFHLSTGFGNTMVGDEAGEFLQDGSTNTAVGRGSQNGNKSSIGNTSVGQGALSGQFRLAGGQLVGCNTFPNNSTAVGYNAINTDTMTDANDAFGAYSLEKLVSGNSNAGFGQNTLGRATSQIGNTALGANAGALLAGSCSANTLVGANAGLGSLSSFSQNTIIGYAAGQNLSTGSGNVILGYLANASVNSFLNNSLWIDVGNNSTPLIYGNFSNGRIGLGTTSPDTRLHIVGNLKQVDGQQGVGKVLMDTSGTGVAVWKTISTSGSYSFTSPLVATGTVVSLPLSSGKIFVGDGSNIATATVVSGDATLANTGVLTLTNTAVSAGTYSLATVTVDSKGRITSASSGTASAGTQTITLTGDATGTGTASIGVTLATVNSNVGSFGSASTTNSITVNAKGQTTAISTVAIQIPESQVTNLTTDLAAKAPINNPTFTGNVTLAQDATSNLQAVTLQQLNNAILGTDYKQACLYVTVSTLPTYTYNNGSSGVGATITGVGFGAITFDGVTPSIGNRVLVSLETGGNAPYNGIYTVTTVGGIATLFVLTRATDFNQSSEITTGDAVFISAGNTKASSTYVYNGITSPTLGTTNITFVQTQGAGVYSAGYGISLSTNTFSADTTTSNTLVSKPRLNAQLAGYLPISNPAYTGTLTTGTLGYSATNALATLQSSTNNFNQFVIRNSNNGSTASTGFITNNDQSTNTTFYGEFGQNSSGFTGSGIFNQPNYVYLTSTSSDLAIGTTTNNGIHLVVNSGTTDAVTVNTDATTSLRIKPRVQTVTTSSLITINSDITDAYTVTSLTIATTFNAPTGTPVDLQTLIVRIKSDASPHGVTFSTSTNGFRFSTDAPAPTTTTASKTMYLGFRWNAADSKWDNISPYIDNF